MLTASLGNSSMTLWGPGDNCDINQVKVFSFLQHSQFVHRPSHMRIPGSVYMRSAYELGHVLPTHLESSRPDQMGGR